MVGWGTRVTTITGSGWTLTDSPLCLPALGGSAGGDSSGKGAK